MADDAAIRVLSRNPGVVTVDYDLNDCRLGPERAADVAQGESTGMSYRLTMNDWARDLERDKLPRARDAVTAVPSEVRHGIAQERILYPDGGGACDMRVVSGSRALAVTATALVMSTLSALCADSQEKSGYDGPKEKLHVYLLIGGVNMCGRAEFTRKDGEVAVPGCLLLNRQDRWEAAENPLNRHSSLMPLLGAEGLGPGHTFALTMRAGDPSVQIGLVVNAVVDRKETSIGEWRKGTEYYNEAVRRAKAAQAGGTLQGILWHQGEGDVKDARYLDKLIALVADLRGDLGDPQLPFVAGQIGAAVDGARALNDQIALLPAQVARTGCASSEGIEIRGRAFDNTGVRVLGRRYAEAMLGIQGRPVPAEDAKPDQLPGPEPAAGIGYTGPRDKLHIYILIGQSNMSGRAEYSKDDACIIDRCFLLNGENRWEPARVPLNRYSSLIADKPLTSERLSPGYTFAKTMLEHEKDPAVRIGLISNARGSTFIRHWRGGYLTEVSKRFKIVQETGVLKGILWHQGESDNKNAGYLEELEGMIADYRKELGDPALPFVAGQILDCGGTGKLINDQLARLPDGVQYTGLASSEGLTGTGHVLINTGSVHFDMESMKTLGRRYAEAMLDIQGKLQREAAGGAAAAGRE